MIALVYGGDFYIMSPKNVTFDDEGYDVHMLMQQFKYFGPFPPKYAEVINGGEEIDLIIQYVFDHVPKHDKRPFSQGTPREVVSEDKHFICEVMKLDWGDRLTAQQLLKHDWLDSATE